MTKRTKRRPAPKKKATKRAVKKTVTKRRIVKAKPLPELCSYFACKAEAVQIVRKNGVVVEAYCDKHKLTADDIAFRERMNDMQWMIVVGIPALRKLAKDYPQYARKPLASQPAMM